MKKILTFLLFSALSVFADNVIHLYGDYTLGQKKDAIKLEEFKKIDGMRYKLSGDLYEKQLENGRILIIKFIKDSLAFTTVFSEIQDISEDDITRDPDVKNSTMLLKGVIRTSESNKEAIYSKADVDLSLKDYKNDVSKTVLSLKNFDKDVSALFISSFVEMIDNQNFRGITRISVCKSLKDSTCKTCDYINGINKVNSCDVFETYHEVK